MGNVILVDCHVPDNWEFRQALEEKTGEAWSICALVSNQNHNTKLQNVIRYLKYFWLPCKILFSLRKYKNVLCWQQFFGIILACYLRLFGIKKVPNITVMTFIYKQKKSFWGKLYFKFVRYAVQSGYIQKIIIYSHSEQEHYAQLFHVPKDLFSVLSLGVEDQYEKYRDQMTESFFLAPGRSNRDYAFLADVWPDEDRLKIICDTCKAHDTPSIQYLKNCHGEQYMQELSKCYAVVIPLQDEKISSGQLVILHALMLGKPIIVTRNETVLDYVEDGVTGLVIEKDRQSLLDAIQKLKDAETYRILAQNGRKSFEQRFSLYMLGSQVGGLLE